MAREFSRTEMIIGQQNLEKLRNSTIAVFGIGGVGSFTVEALARCGIGNLVLVDYDEVCESNINRQIHATQKTIGKPKVEVMKNRINEIHPLINVNIYKEKYNAQTAEKLLSDHYTYVVDAIDMVTSKIDLIIKCKNKGIPIISSMGTGNKINPTMLQVGDIYETSVCPLAKVMRRELRKRGIDSLKVVFSREKPIKPYLDENCIDEDKKNRRQVPGSIAFVPSVAGLIIASEVVKDIIGYKKV